MFLPLSCLLMWFAVTAQTNPFTASLCANEGQYLYCGTSSSTCTGDSTPCTTCGVSCSDGRITGGFGSIGSINFCGRTGSGGTLPTELGLLGGVLAGGQLCLESEQLSGTIPTQVGLLSGLLWLVLHTNQLVGPVPSEVGLLAAVTQVELHGNAGLTVQGNVFPQKSYAKFTLDGSRPASCPVGSLLTDYALWTGVAEVLNVAGTAMVPPSSQEPMYRYCGSAITAVTCSTSLAASVCAADTPFTLTFSAGDTSGPLGCGSSVVALKSYGEGGAPCVTPILCTHPSAPNTPSPLHVAALQPAMRRSQTEWGPLRWSPAVAALAGS